MRDTQKMPGLAALAVAATAFAGHLPALAQTEGNPGFTTPSPRAPEKAPVPNPQDRLFVQLVGQGGIAEVDLARLAESKARSDAVKRFARRMLVEHTQANGQLASAARQSSLEPPSQPSAEHKAMHAQLASLEGAAFDDAYMRGQLVEHQKTVQLLQWEMGSGQDPALQRFAATALPAVLDHLAEVQQVQSQLAGSATRMGPAAGANVSRGDPARGGS
jgi:putative membrane protein